MDKVPSKRQRKVIDAASKDYKLHPPGDGHTEITNLNMKYAKIVPVDVIGLAVELGVGPNKTLLLGKHDLGCPIL